MQTQEERDRKTVDIGVALGLFVLIVGTGALLLGFAHAFLGLSEDVAGVIGFTLCALAGIAMIGYLFRVRAR
ncbi:hypothetical protein SFC88_04490 [Nocardioides sp. HM23]|uniref:hypothetical protein n=1 Tax=Nocardioides bizhenqiangii TaxID=3095076 RepID=UPI002ACA86EB|nr:hypothetical protein [Nocardioides sp. HM23]MDZ5620067.1 hypothetical protein [Nocardioides sp. HM23]